MILHELAHYIVYTYGVDDSPGGPHSGQRVSPVIAWSEGLATFLASVLLESPVQLDLRDGEVHAIDLEALDAPGTEGDEVDGRLSEYLVAGLLWDLFDTPDTDDDGYAVPLEEIVGVLFELLPIHEEARAPAGSGGLSLRTSVWPPEVDEAACVNREISALIPNCMGSPE